MLNSEQRLEHASKALKLIRQLKKQADACLENNPDKKNLVFSKLEDLKNIFEPYHIELQTLVEERRQHALKAQKICTEKGHVGKWSEETFFKEIPVGDLGDFQIERQPFVHYVRTCKRCGQQEISKTKPEDVKKREKREEIRKLQDKINNLKAEL